MTNAEWAARRDRIEASVKASNNRVQDFVNLVALMCAERTAGRKRCGDPAFSCKIPACSSVTTIGTSSRSPSKSGG